MTPDTTYDAVVAGGGPAGLSAALMLGRSRRRTLVIDAGQPRNRFAEHMHAVLGQDGVPPETLALKGREELERYGVEFAEGVATDVADAGAHLTLTVDGREIATRALVLATGATDNLPDIPGLRERWGVSVLHCPYCHGWEVRDLRLGVAVLSPMHAHLPLLVRQLSDSVTAFVASPDMLDSDQRDAMRARGITVVDGAIAALHGPGTALAEIETEDGRRFQLDALFAGGGMRPHDGSVTGLGLARSDTPVGSFLEVDAMGKTSHPRVWAAGNVATPMAAVPHSMAAGATAGAAVNGTLAMEDAQLAAASAAEDPTDYWELRYGATHVWSGKVNATVADLVAPLTPGTALDLGCGEGGDVTWLAQRGWKAHGVDLSAIAIGRATEAADAQGRSGATFEAADLADWQPHREYDLVTASFLHSPVELPREQILRRAATWVAPGGYLVIVSHGAPPPWASAEHVRHHSFTSAEAEFESLRLDPQVWTAVAVEERERSATGPDGRLHTLTDGVVMVRRA